MKCIFEETIDLPDGRFRSTTCINKAEIFSVDNSCYGLCFTCGYNKLAKRIKELEAENAALKEWRRRYDAGEAERKWKTLGGSW